MLFNLVRMTLLSAGMLCGVVSLLLGQTPSRGRLARELLSDHAAEWRTLPADGWEIHVRRGSAADTESAAIVRLVSDARRYLTAKLALSSSRAAPGAQVFFAGSRDEIRRLTGRPLAGFVQSDEPTGFFAYVPGYRHDTLLRHELTHLLTFQDWGPTRQGPWLIEGVAAWVTNGCQGHSSDALAAGVFARGALVPLTRLASSFRELPEDVAMSEAGSIVGLLIERGGLARVRALWQNAPGGSHPLGSEGPEIEAAWRERIRRATPATIDVSRAIKEGC